MESWGEEELSEELVDDPSFYSVDENDEIFNLQQLQNVNSEGVVDTRFLKPSDETWTQINENNFDTVFANELSEVSEESMDNLDLSHPVREIFDHTYCKAVKTQNADGIAMNTSNVAEDSIAELSFNDEEFDNIQLGTNPNFEVISDLEITTMESDNMFEVISEVEISTLGSDSTNIQNENVEGVPQKKRRLSPSEWKREKNKKLRMEGLPYLGFSKPKGGQTKHDTPREGRKMGVACSSKQCAKAKNRKCEKFTEEDRREIFEKYWKEMNWDQRKVYISNLVQNVQKKRKITKEETSRREVSREFHLYLNNERVQVCKTMFLNTLGIKAWTVRQWLTSSSGNGVHKSKEIENRSRRQNRQMKRPSREIACEFLQSLPTLPSHYCRKSTTKMYLEQYHTSHLSLYNVFKEFCKEKNATPVGRKLFMKIFNELNLALYSPKKDKCDVCCSYEVKQIDKVTYDNHIAKKVRAREEKENDKNNKNQDGTEKEVRHHVFTMDVQAVKVSPFLYASALYYKTKLNCHNFTVYHLGSREATCYWFNESEADLSADTFASCIVHKIRETTNKEKLPVIVYSDGCTNQNRNCIMSNALLHLSVELDIDIYQKFLEKGHTQMECDSVHSTIEQCLKKKEIYLPSDYLKCTKDARSNPTPYEVVEVDHTFVKKYSDPTTMVYNSIRPGLVAGDPTVTNLHAIWYKPQGQILYKLDFDDGWKNLPRRPKKVQFPATFNVLHHERLKIPQKKYQHLQELKFVLPRDCHHFYDSLPH